MRESEIRKKASSPMVITVKGILKIIAKIFTVHKEHEIKIGYPTDVRHVSHIGLGSSDSCPSWMNEFRRLEESAGSIARSMQISWASLDFEQPFGVPLPAEVSTDSSGHEADSDSTGKPNGPCPSKNRRTTKARESWSSSSARSSSLRSTASFATACEDLGDLQLQSTLRIVA